MREIHTPQKRGCTITHVVIDDLPFYPPAGLHVGLITKDEQQNTEEGQTNEQKD